MKARFITLIAMVLAGTLAWIAPSARATRPSAEFSVPALVPALMKRYVTPGVAVALIKNRRIVYEQGFGSTGDSAVTESSVFGAGSVSKTVSGIGVMKLVQDHRVALDEPADAYLRRWHFPPTRFHARPTVRELASHTSGATVDGYIGTTDPRSLPALVDSLRGRTHQPVRIVTRPGARFAYSSGGYAVLQLLIEDVTRRPFSAFMRDSVFQPLGMNDSSFVLTERQRAKLALPFRTSAKREVLHYLTEQAPDGLFTTAHDMAKLLIALTGPNSVLDGASLSELTTPQPATVHADPLARNSFYGLGVSIEKEPGNKVVLWHPGVVPGYAAMIATLADGSSGIAVLANADPGIHLAESLVCAWSKHALGKQLGICTSTDRLERTAVVVAQSSTAGLIVAALAILIGVATRKRRPRTSKRRFMWGTLSGAPLIVIGGAWWFFWFTNTITAKVWHEDITPVALAPSSLRVWSYPLIALCAVVSVAMMVTERTVKPHRISSSAAMVAAASAWIVAWQTDLLTRLVVGITGLVPAKEIGGVAGYVPAAFGVIAIVVALVRARNGPQHATVAATSSARP